MKVKHKKYKNTGIVFELLVRKLTNDTLDGIADSKVTTVIKEYFKKDTMIKKEYLLYQLLQKKKFVSEEKANRFIDAVLDEYNKINKSTLRREKYNLIRDINNNFNGLDFFKTEIPEYKLNASIYKLFENTFNNPSDRLNCRYMVVESLTGKKIDRETSMNNVITEYSKQDKDLRILAYKILLEKFNEKYGSLDNTQKVLLREYINNISNSTKLKSIVNTCVDDINTKINYYSKKITDPILKIKLTEVKNQFINVKNDSIVRDKHILSLMRSYDLLKELKTQFGATTKTNTK